MIIFKAFLLSKKYCGLNIEKTLDKIEVLFKERKDKLLLIKPCVTRDLYNFVSFRPTKTKSHARITTLVRCIICLILHKSK